MCRRRVYTAMRPREIRLPQPVRRRRRSRCRAASRRSRSAATPTASNRVLRLPTRRSHPTATSAPRLARSPASPRSRTVRACCSIRAGARPQGRDPSRRLRPDRYAQLMSSGGSLPVYPALSAGDSEGSEDSAFGAAFAGFDAPFGEGATPAGVSTANIPPSTGTVRPGAHTHYAFDSTGPPGPCA